MLHFVAHVFLKHSFTPELISDLTWLVFLAGAIEKCWHKVLSARDLLGYRKFGGPQMKSVA